MVDELTDDDFRLLEVNNISDLVAHVENPEIRAIDEIVLDLSLALQRELEDKELLSSVYKQASEYEQKTAFIIDLLNERKASQRNAKFTSLIATANSMNYEGEVYSANIYIPNLDHADITKTPIISPAYELEDTEECIDCIAAYRKNPKSGEWYLIMLSEAEALGTDEPVIVVSQSSAITKEIIIEGLFIPKNEVKLDNIIQNERAFFQSYYTGAFAIYKRHETSGDSEIGLTTASWSHYSTLGGGSGYGSREWEVVKVAKSKVGGNLYYRTSLFDSRFTRHGEYGSDAYPTDLGTFSGFNMFERDWYHGLKDMGKVKFGLKTLYLSGEARFSGDFYLHSPFGAGLVPVFNDAFVDSNGSINYSYTGYGRLTVSQ